MKKIPSAHIKERHGNDSDERKRKDDGGGDG